MPHYLVFTQFGNKKPIKSGDPYPNDSSRDRAGLSKQLLPHTRDHVSNVTHRGCVVNLDSSAFGLTFTMMSYSNHAATARCIPHFAHKIKRQQ